MREAFFNFLRTSNGYQFPRLGRLGHATVYRWLRPDRVKVDVLPGVRAELDLSEDVSGHVYYSGERYEYPTGEILVDWCRDATAPVYFFDIGANFGFFSFLVQNRVPGVQCHAFEPNPRTFARLERIVRENSLDRVHPYPIGIGSADERLPFFSCEKNAGSSTFSANSNYARVPVGDIEIRTFETFLAGAGLSGLPARSCVAKIDVEGFDLRVLKGMASALRRRLFRGLSVEVEDRNLAMDGTTSGEVMAFLTECGYREIGAAASCRRRWKIATENRFFVPI